ncbi:hypothetical protein CLOM_g646 [Closterium sp. NIES-68]|nr:hypothetical protein CLOM_g646 [Closterium sp. NIES-68]
MAQASLPRTPFLLGLALVLPVSLPLFSCAEPMRARRLGGVRTVTTTTTTSTSVSNSTTYGGNTVVTTGGSTTSRGGSTTSGGSTSVEASLLVEAPLLGEAPAGEAPLLGEHQWGEHHFWGEHQWGEHHFWGEHQWGKRKHRGEQWHWWEHGRWGNEQHDRGQYCKWREHWQRQGNGQRWGQQQRPCRVVSQLLRRRCRPNRQVSHGYQRHGFDPVHTLPLLVHIAGVNKCPTIRNLRPGIYNSSNKTVADFDTKDLILEGSNTWYYGLDDQIPIDEPFKPLGTAKALGGFRALHECGGFLH